MKVSIALCTYNGEKFLSEQLESYLSQTRLPDELIVCDDRSTDKTATVINGFSKKAPFPVKLTINENNLGSTKNFERAISLCTGDIIFLSDQDDIWMPEKIELIENEFEKSPEVGMVFTDAEIVDENLHQSDKRLWDYFLDDVDKQQFAEGNGFDILMYGGKVTGATMAFRAELKAIILPIPVIEKFIHDSWIAFMSIISFKVILLNIPLMKYRQHSSQQLGIKDHRIVLPNQSRLEEHSRYEAYNDSVERQERTKNRMELLRKACETALKNNSAHESKLKIIKDPIFPLIKTEKSLAKVIGHFEVRRDMPKNHIKRIPKIVPELLNGNYHRYSRGFRSALLDFIERIK